MDRSNLEESKMVRESVIYCFKVYSIYYTEISFIVLSRGCASTEEHVGKEKDRCDDLWQDRHMLPMFYSYPCHYR